MKLVRVIVPLLFIPQYSHIQILLNLHILDVYKMFTGRLPDVYQMFAECLLNVYQMFTKCLLNVYRTFTGRLSDVL